MGQILAKEDANGALNVYAPRDILMGKNIRSLGRIPVKFSSGQAAVGFDALACARQTRRPAKARTVNRSNFSAKTRL